MPPYVEVLTFAILWIGPLIEQEPIEICRIKSYIIKSTLNVTARARVEKISKQYLHLLKTENCRL